MLPRTNLPENELPRANDGELRAAEAELERAIEEVTQGFVQALKSFEPLDALNERLASGVA
jgi:hypothetical protein